jgi:hypothetical protein
MFPAIMPWPMTLTPTNEAIRCENWAKKTFIRKKFNRHDLRGHERFEDSITIKEAYDFVRVGERGIELMVLMFIFCLIYRISSVNGCTLQIIILVLYFHLYEL